MKDCFIICPLGEKDSEIRKRSDSLLKHVLSPVLTKNDYKSIRSDQISKVGLITSQIINLIIESPLVIADLTGSNPNVFYELAIRHAVRQPYIQLINKGEKIPFDVGGIRTIEFNINDLDSVDLAKEEIEKQIKEYNKGHKPDSPISIASKVRLLQEDRDLAEEIANKLSEYTESDSYDGGCNCWYGDEIETILRKLWGFSEYGFLSLEDLDKKLTKILSKLEDKSENNDKS